MDYDALILVSFGGPEGPDDVLPFLRNVVRGRGVPDERLAEVARHYDHFGGVSPLNAQCRALLEALRLELGQAGVTTPLHWGNRNWHPFLADTLAQLRDDGVQRALAFVTSPFGSYSSCRQYLDDIEQARAMIGSTAPIVDKIRHYHDHPGYIEPHAQAVRQALAEVGADGSTVDDGVRIVFTAHSIPTAMDACSGPEGYRYTAQLRETAALVAQAAAPDQPWDLVWQSRSGAPHVPWLEPDINDHLVALKAQDVQGVVVSPIGFISDHLEVVWDLDTQAAETAKGLDMRYARAATPGTDPRFVAMIRDLILERLDPATPRARLGTLPMWDTCPDGCCISPS